MSAIFNPLFNSESGSDKHTSESRMINEDVGVCPKCKANMSLSKLSSEDEIYFCDKCCVAMPTPDNK